MHLQDLQNLAGQEVSLGYLRELNKALRANAGYGISKGTVGYPQQGVGFTTPELAPLVPQSIQPTLDTASHTQKHLVFWNDLNKIPVTGPLHEATRVNEHGSQDLDPFFAEGATGVLSEAQYERLTVQIKYLSEFIEVTDVATMVGILGVNRQMLAQRTQNGTLALLRKLENALFNAAQTLSPLHFDGLYSQIRTGASANYTDNAGNPTSPQQLQEVLGALIATPNFAMPTVCYVEPQIYQALTNIATTHGRHDHTQEARIVFGGRDLFVGSPYGIIPIKPVPLMMRSRTPSATAIGSGAPATPVLAGAIAVAADPASKFTAADAGTYIYKVVAVGDGGVSAPLTTAGAAIAAGEKATLTIDDDAITDSGEANNSVRYYRLYRTPAGGAAGTATLVWTFPRTPPGVDSTIVDLNEHRPSTGQVYVMQLDPTVMYWASLLDFTRRPLAQVKTTVPFLLMMFGSLFVKLPKKAWIIDNVSFTL